MPSARARRVLVISYHFPPNIEIGAQACAQIARHLHRYGWEPIVLTVRECYAQHIDARPDGTFPGLVFRTRVLPHPISLYARLRSRRHTEADRGADGEGSTPSTSVLRQWLHSLLTIPDVYTGWILPATIAGVREIRRRGVDHLFSSGPCWTN